MYWTGTAMYIHTTHWRNQLHLYRHTIAFPPQTPTPSSLAFIGWYTHRVRLWYCWDLSLECGFVPFSRNGVHCLRAYPKTDIRVPLLYSTNCMFSWNWKTVKLFSSSKSSGSERPPSAPPSLSQQTLVMPSWRAARTRTQSENQVKYKDDIHKRLHSFILGVIVRRRGRRWWRELGPHSATCRRLLPPPPLSRGQFGTVRASQQTIRPFGTAPAQKGREGIRRNFHPGKGSMVHSSPQAGTRSRIIFPLPLVQHILGETSKNMFIKFLKIV